MPNRYEREIEEILRNLETTDPKTTRGQKFGDRLRRKPDYRVPTRRRSLPTLNFKASDWFLVIAVAAALISGGYAYANEGRPDVVTGILAIVGVICLVLLVLSPFLFRPRSSLQGTRYGKVTPLSRNPLRSIASRWNLFLLKIRYRRKKGG